MEEIQLQRNELKKQAKSLGEAIAFTQSMPTWVRLSSAMMLYNPEAVLLSLTEAVEKVDDCLDLALFLVAVARHRIHRFGAGPAISEEELAEIERSFRAYLEQNRTVWPEKTWKEVSENLSKIWQTSPMVPRYPQNDIEKHVYVEKGPWPILLF